MSNSPDSTSILWALFAKHPASVGETYSEHLTNAAWFGLQLVGAGLACLIHAVVPIAFPHRASDTVGDLSKQLADRMARSDCGS